MVSSIGYSLGAGSGIDTQALIESLAAASRDPKEAAIKKREDKNAAQISAIAEASSAIDGFSTALNSLISGGTLFSQPSVSDSSILSATAKAGVRIEDFSAQIEVRQIAQAQTLVSAPLAATDTVGTGALTVTIGGASFTVTIDGSNNSLQGLAKAINDQKKGVTASIVTEGDTARLVLKGATGASNAFTLSVPEGTNSGLERFAFGTGVTDGLSVAQDARDAVLIYDGVEVKRSSNTITDLVPGMNLDIKKASAGATVRLGVTRPTESIKQAVEDFVATYNELHTILSELSSSGSGGSEAGPLRGDLGVREMQRQLARLPAMVLNTSGGPATLAEIGVATSRDGTLTIRTDVLNQKLADDPQGVEALFNPSQYSNNPSVAITSALGKVKPGTYTLTDLVPAANGGNASGKINGIAMTGTGEYLVAPAASTGVGLVVRLSGSATSATITVDPGLGGALQSIRDALLVRGGPVASTKERLGNQADDIADAREAMERREDAYRNQLVKTYAAMESRVSAFKATQSYLEQQIKAWNSSDD